MTKDKPSLSFLAWYWVLVVFGCAFAAFRVYTNCERSYDNGIWYGVLGTTAINGLFKLKDLVIEGPKRC